MDLKKRGFIVGALVWCTFALPAQTQPSPGARVVHAPATPRLVVAIVIDQFRYDYLTRFRSEYTGGLKRMLNEGADFTNSRYRHYPTVTAVGHSTFLSGATPSMSGIIGNEWWDRTTGAVVSGVSDTQTQLLGGSGAGSSPRRLLQSTVGDELKASGKGGKVIGISIKDRAAILPSGPFRRCGVLVRQRLRKLRQQHVLLRDAAAVGRGHQPASSRRQICRARMVDA